MRLAKGVFITDRETEVAKRLAQGMTRRQIADELGISLNAVDMRIKQARRRDAARREADRTVPSHGGKPARFKPYSLLTTDHV